MITILCAGSRGDVQPYIALAQQLKILGKEVKIAGSKSFEDFVKSYMIDFHPIQADIQSLNIDPRLLKEASSADNPFKMLLAFRKMKRYGIFTTSDYYAACEGSELIVYHPGCTIGFFAAKKLGIPSVLASPFPMHKTKEVLSVVMYGKAPSNFLTKKISYALIQGMLWMASKDSVKVFWKERFGEIPDYFGKPYEKHIDERHPAIVSCSNFIFKRPDDWSVNVHQYGYWFVEEPTEFIPSDQLAAFLSNGEKPVYIGFGSMTALDRHDGLAEMAVEALRMSGQRGIISGLGSPANLPDSVFAINNIPHSWLFDKVSAVCHHGGAGTSAAGFRAGVPSIIIPFSNDQFAWAHRAYDIGVGAKPISKKELSADKLADAIRFALSEKIQFNAKRLAMNIAIENGAEASANIIVGCLEKDSKHLGS